jgi:hypothetical protein
MSKRQEAEGALEEMGLHDDVLFADGFDDAIIGIGSQFNTHFMVYDWDKCVEILIAGGCDIDGAGEYMGYNVTGAYVGKHTPVFVSLL